MIRERFFITSIYKSFKIFNGFQKSLVLDFCAEESLIAEVSFSKLSLFHFLFPLTIFELQILTIILQGSCKGKRLVQKKVCGHLIIKRELVLEIVELGTPV